MAWPLRGRGGCKGLATKKKEALFKLLFKGGCG